MEHNVNIIRDSAQKLDTGIMALGNHENRPPEKETGVSNLFENPKSRVITKIFEIDNENLPAHNVISNGVTDRDFSTLPEKTPPRTKEMKRSNGFFPISAHIRDISIYRERMENIRYQMKNHSENT